MSDLICPFGNPLIKHDMACSQAQEIIRRGGAEIACQNEQSHALCCGLHTSIKASALKAMDLPDDLSLLPHNVLVKIQSGGLLGLQAVCMDPVTNTSINDVSVLVASAISKFNEIDNLPFDELNEAIMKFKSQRRGKH